MKPLLKIGILLAVAVALPLSGTAAQDQMTASLKIEAPWSRATPGGARVGAGYLRITNTGTAADRLTAIESPIAGRAQVHQMTINGGIMRMRALANGLQIPAGKTVELKPGGYHVMFMGLKQGLEKGRPFKATLTFEKAGKVAVEFAVEGIGAMKTTGGTMVNHKARGGKAPIAPKAGAPRGSH